MKLHVEHHGERGPAVVLCHGFGGSARNFRPQARAMAGRARLWLYDARGHARSEAPRDPDAYRPEAFVDDMLCVVEQTSEQRAIVGGLSMGAGIALRFALAHPERVAALLLASFPRSADDPGHRQWALDFADALERDGVEAAGEAYVWGRDAKTEDREERGAFEPKSAALVRQGFLEHSAQGLAHTLRGLIAVQPSVASLADELAALSVVVLVIAGENDQRSLPACRDLAAAIPGSDLVVVPGGGHVVNLTHPKAFNEALLALVERAAMRDR